jgi:mycofactocin precursor
VLEAVLGEQAERGGLDVGMAGGLRSADPARHGSHPRMLASFHFCHQCSYCAAMDTDVMDAAVMDAAQAAQETDLAQAAEDLDADDLTTEDLIEEVSIDGMCGVY